MYITSEIIHRYYTLLYICILKIIIYTRHVYISPDNYIHIYLQFGVDCEMMTRECPFTNPDTNEVTMIPYTHLNPKVIIEHVISKGLDYDQYFVGDIPAPDDVEFPIKDFRTGKRVKRVLCWKRYLLHIDNLQMFWLQLFIDGGAGLSTPSIPLSPQ